MGLFSRAYKAALKTAQRSPTEAAALTGLSQPSLSRIVSGETLPDPENIGKLLLALEPGDRTHCLRQYLLEHTPEDYHGRMILTFGDVQESPPAATDELSIALKILDQEATNNPHLEAVIVELAKTMSGEDKLSFGAPVEELLDAADRKPGVDAESKTDATGRAGPTSLKPKRDSKR